MKNALVFIIFIFSMQSSFADDGVGKLYHFSEDIRNIVWESEPIPEGFVLSTEDTDRAVAYMDLDQEIGEYAFSQTQSAETSQDLPCPQLSASESSKKALEEKIKKRKYNIYFSMTFNDAEALGLAEGFMGKNNYDSFILSHASSGNPKSYGIQNLGQLTGQFKSKNPHLNFDSLSLKEKEKKLIDFAKNHSGVEIPKGMLLSEMAIDHAIKNPNNWKSGLAEIKSELSFDQKVLIASHLGGKFSDRYNYDRAGKNGRGVVTIEEMLTSVRDGTPGGICRDVSMAQAAILKELGVPKDKIYQVGYTTSGGGHAVVAIQDPDNPKNIVKLNYGYVSESNEAIGSSALIQDTSLPDFGINNRIYNADGDPVSSLPTEIGEILYDSSGGNKGKITPPSRHNLQKVGIDTPFGEGQIFTGETSSGDKVLGVTLQKTFNTKYLTTEVAGGLIQRDGDRSLVQISQEALYGRLKNTLNSPTLEAGNFSLSSRVGLESEVLVMKNEVKSTNYSDKSDTNTDASVRPFIGATANWTSNDRKTKVESDIEVEGFFTNKNIQLHPKEGMTVAFNKATFKTGISRQVTDEMKIVGETGVVLRQIGNSASFSGGIVKENSDSNFRAIATYSTPLSKDVPAFMPESQKTFGLSIGEDKKKSGLYYRLNYNRNLDNKSNAVGVTAGWKF